jgi:hypothetical protein
MAASVPVGHPAAAGWNKMSRFELPPTGILPGALAFSACLRRPIGD